MGKVLYYNTGSKEMEHLTRNVTMFREMGMTCKPFKYFSKDIIFKKCDYLYLNWYENIYKGAFPVALGMYCAKQIALFIAKIKGIRIVSSQHNRVQHDAKYKRLSLSMFKTIYKDSDSIIVFSQEGKKDLNMFLSEEEIQKKAVYIQPVNYIGSYPYIRHDWIDKLYFDDRLTILFIGNMDRPYKNVEMVIDLAKELSDKPIAFVFAGKVSDKDQRAYYLKKIGQAENIIAEFRFVKDEEMAQLLEIGDVVIAPYDVESISNSGTARLAFSYARTVICPMIPSLESIPKELIYTYTYSTAQEHKEKVKAAILQACEDYTHNIELFMRKGSELKSIMEINNSPEVISKKYREIFCL